MPLAVVADVDTMSPQLWFVHADHLERPVRMTNSSQAVVRDAVYPPFQILFRRKSPSTGDTGGHLKSKTSRT